MKNFLTFAFQIIGGSFSGIILAIMILPTASYLEARRDGKNSTSHLEGALSVLFFLVPAAFFIAFLSTSGATLFSAICVAIAFHWRSRAGKTAKIKPSQTDITPPQTDTQKPQKIESTAPPVPHQKFPNSREQKRWQQGSLFDVDSTQ